VSKAERDTSQRRALRRIFEEAGRPLTPQEALHDAKSHAPGIGIATVYRNLKALTENGYLVPVDVPGEPPRYEVAGKGHHHHFHCRACGRLFELEGCPGNLKLLIPKGFKMEDHDVVIYGLCESCNA
jgi:Fur family ferric uptake transcriptional regulator